MRIRLQHQPFLVLSILLERPGRLVTRDELRERLWPDDTFVNFEHGVTTAVKKLRQALNDSAAKPRYVETLPKRGYRFVAEVAFEEPIEEAPEPAEIQEATAVEAAAVAEPNGFRPTAPDPPEDAPPPPPAEVPAASAPPVATPDAPRGFGRRSVLWGGLAAAAAIALFAFFGSGQSIEASHGVRRFSFQPESLRRADPGPTISPDGRYIAYVGDAPEFGLWIRPVESEDVYRVEGVRDARLPFWSPDSRYIGYVSEGRLLRVSPKGGAPVEVAEMPAGNYSGGTWARDGRIYFSAGFPGRIYQVAAEGGVPEVAFEPAEEDGSRARAEPSAPAFDAGRNLLFMTAGGRAGNRIVVRDLDSGEERRLESGRRASLASSGHLLYDWGGDLWAAPFSAGDLSLAGEPVLTARQAQRGTVSTSGTLVYADDLRADRQERLVWRTADGAREEASEATFDSVWQFALSPDKRQAAVVDRGADAWSLWILDLESGLRRRVAHDAEERLGYPVWSPNGERLAYRVGLRSEAVVRSVDAEGKRGRSADYPAFPAMGGRGPSHWSGRELLFSMSDDIWAATRGADGQWEPRPFLDAPGVQFSAVLSPDSRRVAYCSDETGQAEIFVSNVDDPASSVQVSLSGGMQPWWKSDRELYYVDDGRLVLAEIDANRRTVSTRVLLSHRRLFPDSPRRYVYAPAGDRFLMIESLGEMLRRSIRIVDNWNQEHWPNPS